MALATPSSVRIASPSPAACARIEGSPVARLIAAASPSQGTSTNFAWAIHAGVSYDVTPQTVIDLAYRYSDLGSAQSGAVYTYDGAFAHSGVHIKDVTSNDLLFGVRYKLQREAVVYQPVK